MAASIDSIISEMRGMSDFLTTYQTSLSTRPEELDATKSAMMRSVIAKIHMIANLDFAGGARITEAVSALANDDIIDSGMRDLITSALIQKMQGQPIVTTHARKEPQACMRADRYLVEEDWVLLESTENIQARLGHIRDAMHKVGLTNPSELTLKVLVAIVLCAQGQEHEPSEQKFMYLRQLKSLFQSYRPSNPTLPHLTKYPDHPKFLEDGWRRHAYADKELHEEDIRSYNVSFVAQSVPCRVSNTNVRAGVGLGLSTNAANPIDAHQLLGQLANIVGQGGLRSSASSPREDFAHRRPGDCPGLQIYGNIGRHRSRTPVSRAAALRSSPEFGDGSLPGGEDPPPPKDSQSYEASLPDSQPQGSRPGALRVTFLKGDGSAGGASLGGASSAGASDELALVQHAPLPNAHPAGGAFAPGSAQDGNGAAENAAITVALGDPRVGADELDKMMRAATAAGEQKKAADAAAKKADAAAKPKSMKKPAAAVDGTHQACKPSYTIERSRSQIVCNTGIPGKGRYHTISFKKAGGEKKAKALADKWVAERS